MRELGEDLARWLIGRGVNEDTVGTSLKRVWLRETSSPFDAPFPPSEPGSAPRRREVARAAAVTEEAKLPPRETEAEEEAPTSARNVEPRLTDLHAPIILALEEAILPAARNMSSVPDLEALAELHRGGDPEERFQRDHRRRQVVTFTLLTLAIFGFALAILVGTGVIVW